MPVNENLEKIRRLPWFYTHCAANNFFWIGMFGTVFTLFLDALGLDKKRIGLLQSIIPFMGILALFVAPWVKRVGYKRILFSFWTLRKFVAGLMILTPWIVAKFGSAAAFYWIGGILVAFATCRVIAESALMPWVKEIVPDNIRGTVGAVNTVLACLINMLSLLSSSYLLDRFSQQGLRAYFIIMSLAFCFGLISAFAALFIYGGQKSSYDLVEKTPHLTLIKEAFSDPIFKRYLGGATLLTFAFSSFSFVALYLKESVGFSPGTVLRLEIGSTLGGILAALLWGWAADRFGSKPVMITALWLVTLLPICWFLLPHKQIAMAIPPALIIAVLSGVAINGWGIGSGRYLYVSALPPGKENTYMSVYYTVMGITAGISPFFTGWMIDASASLSYHRGIIHIDKYTPFLAMVLLLLVAAIRIMQKLRSDESFPTRRFVSMFFEGSPVMAATGLIRYHFAKVETQRVLTVKKLGQAQSTLSTHELIEALHDPSFNVRYEAIIAIAHIQKPNLHLIDALLMVLSGNQLELSAAAAWALGQLGDKSAILPLREILLSNYPLLQARCARALADLNDTDSAPFFLEKLQTMPDPNLKPAYASALSMLHYEPALPAILQALDTAPDTAAQAELALAAARLAGHEGNYIRLWRSFAQDIPTTVSKILLQCKKDLADLTIAHVLIPRLETILDQMAKPDNSEPGKFLPPLLASCEMYQLPPAGRQIIRHIRERLSETSKNSSAYLILALHTLQTIITDEAFREAHRLKK